MRSAPFVIPDLSFLLQIYLPIGAAVLLGLGVNGLLSLPVARHWGHALDRQAPAYLGQFLFWIGVPISIVGFLHRADLSGRIFLAPLICWLAMLLGLVCSRLWLASRSEPWPRLSQGSFALAAMLGNTGYIGFPVVLLLPQLGLEYFGWALFYDALGTLFGAYGLGSVMAAEYSETRRLKATQAKWMAYSLEVLRNPTVLSFGLGMLLRMVVFPEPVEQGLYAVSWLMVMLSLVLMGMRLQQLSSWQHVRPAAIAVAIKMLLVPATIGLLLTTIGLDGPQRLVLVVQAGMPCAFANLVLAEAYQLDRDLSVTCVGLSSALLLLTLPLWLLGFPI